MSAAPETLFAQVALPLPLDRLFTYRVPLNLKTQVQVGQFVWVLFRARSLKGIIVALQTSDDIEQDISKIKDISGLIPHVQVPSKLLTLTHWIADHYACSWGEALASVLPGLKKKSKVKPDTLLPDGAPEAVLENPLTPSAQQRAAIQAINQTITQKKFHPYLLFGVTGSGKTEVFLNAIACALAQQRQALFLVPQIALCVPFLAQLKNRFGDKVGVWHFQVAQGAKNSLYEKIQQGRVQIVVGARSALFAPWKDLGVIILDEEHSSSYKQEEKPRYHAREVAWRLAQLHQSALVLGSATPSIESFYKAQKNQLTLLEMRQRVGKSQLPQVLLIDRKIYRQHYLPLTPALKEKITQALAKRQQVVLGLNRRGFSTYVLCTQCAHVWKCPNCKLPLVHHHQTDAEQDSDLLTSQQKLQQHVLQCHYCFYQEDLPLSCLECKSQNIHFGGFGTQKIVQEIKKSFPFARVLRMDRDALSKKAAATETFETFKNEQADILVGTQMVTQGYDFPKVTLVGIVDADTALFHPDFRAAERTFQWVVQAAGRAGRNVQSGQALVQTSIPEHYALQCALDQNYRAFFAQEIRLRQDMHYPPFRRLILLHLQGDPAKDIVQQESMRLKNIFLSVPGLISSSAQTQAPVELLGPGPCPKEWINKQLRWQILLKCATKESLKQCITLAKSFTPKSTLRYNIDVDPTSVL